MGCERVQPVVVDELDDRAERQLFGEAVQSSAVVDLDQLVTAALPETRIRSQSGGHSMAPARPSYRLESKCIHR